MPPAGIVCGPEITVAPVCRLNSRASAALLVTCRRYVPWFLHTAVTLTDASVGGTVVVVVVTVVAVLTSIAKLTESLHEAAVAWIPAAVATRPMITVSVAVVRHRRRVAMNRAVRGHRKRRPSSRSRNIRRLMAWLRVGPIAVGR